MPFSVLNFRWHEHDALEIQHFVDRCIEEAVKFLEAAGWAKESIKIIGALPRTTLASCSDVYFSKE
jgi:hypothetical protein